jgi:hypothetical protein
VLRRDHIWENVQAPPLPAPRRGRLNYLENEAAPRQFLRLRTDGRAERAWPSSDAAGSYVAARWGSQPVLARIPTLDFWGNHAPIIKTRRPP